MIQPDLFPLEIVPLKTRLRRAALDGRLFYSIKQAAKLLEISEFSCRYRVHLYRLDALFIGDKFRIPWTAIIASENDYAAICRQQEATMQYLNLIALNKKESINKIPRKSYDQMDGYSEKDCQDWYDLHRLELPASATARDWEILLGVRAGQVSKDLGVVSSDTVSWPEMYDYLIDHEFINLPCCSNDKGALCGIADEEACIETSLFREGK